MPVLSRKKTKTPVLSDAAASTEPSYGVVLVRQTPPDCTTSRMAESAPPRLRNTWMDPSLAVVVAVVLYLLVGRRPVEVAVWPDDVAVK